MANISTYSFKDTVGAFVHPIAGTYLLVGGNQGGIGQISISMQTERTVLDVAADGWVMVSAVPGDQGHITFEVQQTSPLHQFLLQWLNILLTASNLGDVSNWATATLSVRNILTNTKHQATGVSPTKYPDMSYGPQGGKVTWQLMCAQIINQ